MKEITKTQNPFDAVIGYDSIKNELLQICDMLRNRDAYTRLGAKLPQGVLLYGDPGLGKTLLAKCLIEACGVETYTVRRNKSGENFVGEIAETFRKAKENAPAIVFLDDMDKFANEDNDHKDAEEYVAVQAGIDEVKHADVFVLATVNEMHKLPGSLTRSGRFDRKIEVHCPTDADANKIIAHYLSDKKVADGVDLNDLSKMISYSSCAELETILNEAAIHAAFGGKDSIETEDFVHAVLRMQYNAPDNFTKTSSEDLKRTALHEAGHLVACEALCPGSVGLASLRSRGRGDTGGFIHRCRELPRRAHDIIVSLAGKAAVELYYAETCASGCQSDIARAYNNIRDAISESGTCGVGMIDVETRCSPGMSESLNAQSEAVVHAEMERYLFKARDILLRNRAFLERVADALAEKGTLLYSDIQRLRGEAEITAAAV